MQVQDISLDDDFKQSEEYDEITILKDFGLEEDEAQTYVGLAQLGSAKASEISAFTKIDRVRTYKILENLKNLGFATSTLSSPIKFSANEPESILKDTGLIHWVSRGESLHKIARRYLPLTEELTVGDLVEKIKLLSGIDGSLIRPDVCTLES